MEGASTIAMSRTNVRKNNALIIAGGMVRALVARSLLCFDIVFAQSVIEGASFKIRSCSFDGNTAARISTMFAYGSDHVGNNAAEYEIFTSSVTAKVGMFALILGRIKSDFIGHNNWSCSSPGTVFSKVKTLPLFLF